MNLSPKQSEVRHVINENNLAVCAILESHIASSRLDTICKRVFRHWYWASNNSSCFKGTRIILGWNADIVDTSIIFQSDQVMHTRIWIKAERKELFCSFIYAHNRYTHRRGLWDSLCMHKCFINNRPWCILGDFNAALNIEDVSAGSSFMDISMREFKECIEEIELIDVPRSGLQFTWNQKPQGSNGILKKLDRVMANVEFSNEFVGNYAVFQPYGISDHSPAVLRIPLQHKIYPKPFKFANVVTTFPRFKEVVKDGWSDQVCGFYMFRVVKKLKSLKKPLRKLLYDKGNLHDNVNKLRIEMARVQQDLDVDPTNQDLRDEEAVYVRAFTEALIMEERFLKQKAKIEWLKVDGDLVTDDGVPAAFVSHYEAFLGQPGITSSFDSNNLFLNRLTSDQALDMIKHVTDQEVKEAIFSMGNDKSPGPDGYTACFFKECWDIVASDVVCAVQEFFTNGNLLKELNHTIIALIPKESLKGLISPNQSAFVPGRRISDNILLTQELMHNYHLDRGPSRCAFKVDIQKAYDTVDWGFLKEVLLAFGFHVRMVDWIMECVTTTSFSLSINGTLHGYFKGKRGLRQGDPLSPYLFTLIMEVLTLMLRRKVRDSDGFRYHRYCSDLEIINLCFADDLFIFAHGDPYSAKVIMEAMEEFKNASGLTPSLPKSTAYFCNVLNHTKLSILQILPFEEGRLPVKYLGVPLVSSRLVFRDCKELVDRIRSRINDWKNKSLSAAGRLQLVRSVLGSMHVYWASVFILPSRILLDIEQLMRGFLWCHGEMKKGRAKVAWEVVCLPKNEGGLGVRRLDLFNKALMVPHIWNLITRKESLWVKWIHQYKLRGFVLVMEQLALFGLIGGPLLGLLLLLYLIETFIGLDSIYIERLKMRFIMENGHGLLEIVKPFSVNAVWNCIRPRDVVVNWYDVVWFANCIPSHAFHLWLVAKRRLKTQDLLRPWDVNGADSVKSLAGLPNVIGSISIIVDLLIPFAKRRSARSVVAKLVVAACSYYIWQERNLRLFMNQKRSHSQVTDCIKSSIRLKLLSCTFKKSKDALLFKRLWNLPDSIFW
ncbi:hypothetical protein Tco_0486715 [Tanacetum coccineum]